MATVAPPKPVDLPRMRGDHNALRDLARLLPYNGRLVEVGSFAGESTRIFLEMGLRVDAIDPWDNVSRDRLNEGASNFNPRHRWGFEMSDAECVFDQLLDQYPMTLVKLKGYDTEFVDRYASESLDAVYIDSLHTYADVKRTIESWLPKIKMGGLLCGHDYDPNHSGVMAAIHEACGPPHRVLSDGNWVVHVPINGPPRGIDSRAGQRHRAIRYIALETCAHCNRACHFCPTNNTVHPPKQFLTDEQFEHILADLASFGYQGGISLYGHNEALLDRARLPTFTRRIREVLPHCSQSLSTNGDFLTLELTLELFEAGLTKMLVNCYDDRNGLISRMVEIAKELERRQFCAVQFVPGNESAFPMSKGQKGRGFVLYDARRFTEGFPGLSARGGNVVNFSVPHEPLRRNCERPFTHVHIKYNGNVVLCCQDWAEEVVLGNVFQESLVEIYNGPTAEHYRTRLGQRDRKQLAVCSKCEWGND